MAVGFGAAAARYAARFGETVPLIACSIESGALGLAQAIEWRRAGRFFAVAPLCDEPRAVLAQRLAGAWIERHGDLDERYNAFDALAEGRLHDSGMVAGDDDAAPWPEPARRVLRDAAIAGDVVSVRSRREAERVGRVLGRHRPLVVTTPGEVAAFARAERGGRTVVVWAPQLAAAALGVIAMALDGLRCPVVYVCAGGRLENVRGSFITPRDATGVLHSAACVIDAEIGDPAGAIALAGSGVPLVAASTTGAAEYVAGIIEYDPWNWRTIFAGVMAARGAQPPYVRARAADELDTLLARVEGELPVDGPLVSVVVLTYNRRELLPLALDSIARQRYGNIEIILVNNGGTDVTDIAARYPNVTLLTLAENLLPNAAVDRGFDACSGAYFCVTSDDDEYFPDHFARLVAALERSGEAVGHTNTVTRYLCDERGKREAVAYRVRADRPSDRLQILVGSTMSFNSMLFRAEVRNAIGPLRIDIAPADLEYQVRAAQHYDFVHVDAVTCEWNCAIDASSYSFRENMYEGLKVIYDLYPSGGSAIVEGRRRAEVERFSSRRAGEIIWSPDALLPVARG